MNVLIVILKCLIILSVNIGFGMMICACLRFYLFHHKKEVIFKKYHISFTPGLLYRKKKQFILYLKKLINNYYEYIKKDYTATNFLTEYERKIYHAIYPIVIKYIDKDWLPDFVREKMYDIISKMTWFIVRMFARNILPQMLAEWKIYTKIDHLDVKIDIYEIKHYFDKYLYHYLLKFSLTFFTIVGLINMAMFLILA